VLIGVDGHTLVQACDVEIAIFVGLFERFIILLLHANARGRHDRIVGLVGLEEGLLGENLKWGCEGDRIEGRTSEGVRNLKIIMGV
jgi:hypothetical protein